MLGRLDDSWALAEKIANASARDVGPVVPTWGFQHLIVVSVWRGDLDRAAELAREFTAQPPENTISAIRRYFRSLKDQDFVERYYDALRQAGVPET